MSIITCISPHFIEICRYNRQISMEIDDSSSIFYTAIVKLISSLNKISSKTAIFFPIHFSLI